MSHNLTSQTPFRHIIFDLDGTLVDSLPGIRCSLEEATRRCGLDIVVPELRHYVGPPIVRMLPRIWPELPETTIETLLLQFRKHYDSVGCLQSVLFPEVMEVLERIREAGLSVYLLTNKPFAATSMILDHLRIRRLFNAIFTPDVQEPPFPSKLAAARELRRIHQLEGEATLVVGDGADDAAAAESCGFGFIRAAYGYGGIHGNCRSVDAFTELETIILKPKLSS